ncbi:hypothetical protein CALVIDRAFT_598343 [Calocera viscosa TUFC12733]|uniref:Uncharacterized protein n=1 Tax=Calocera viscosa (strain TUFC12733) TaxID=1330018 RepID=A0A167M6I6_CALVF|nr:hypothetical protein CALVIDRAFT_598343 [Calocera viscosa TUFC12733]
MTSPIPFPSMSERDTNQDSPESEEHFSSSPEVSLANQGSPESEDRLSSSPEVSLAAISKYATNHSAATVQACPVAATASVADGRRLNGRTTKEEVSHITAVEDSLLAWPLHNTRPSGVPAELNELDLIYLTDDMRRVLKGEKDITEEHLKDLLNNLKRIGILGMQWSNQLKVLAEATGFGQALNDLEKLEINAASESASLRRELRLQAEKLLSIAEITTIPW